MKHYLPLCAAALLCAMPLLAAEDSPAAADTHKVNKGETLWSISGKYYGDKEKWPQIFRANKDKIKDPHWIYPGMKIDLPKDSLEAAEPKEDAKAAPITAAAPTPLIQPEVATSQAQALETSSGGPMAEEQVPPSIVPVKTEDKPKAETPASEEDKPIAYTTIQAGNSAEKIENSGVKTIVSEKLDVSNEMPIDVTWTTPSNSGLIVPNNWKEDGYVKYTNPDDHEDDMAETGDIIELKLTSKTELKPGEIVGVYQRGSTVTDKKGHKTGITIHQAALVKIRDVNGSHLTGEIVRMTNPVSKEDIFKKE